MERTSQRYIPIALIVVAAVLLIARIVTSL
jgi:hypothetical protein